MAEKPPKKRMLNAINFALWKMSRWKWKYRILFTFLAIPCVIPATASILHCYETIFQPHHPPDSMRLDLAYGGILIGSLLLILFPILGFKFGKSIDLSRSFED